MSPEVRLVQTRGTINRTQFFEIIENEGLKSLIKMAGGLKSTTYMKRVSISRIISPENRLKTGVDRTIVDVNLNDLFSSGSDFELLDGDIVEFFSITSEKKDIVSITGAVKRSGIYDFGNGIKLTELIEKADGLIGNAYKERANIVRRNPDFSLAHLDVNLDKAFMGDTNHDIDLKSNDQVTIYNYADMKFNQNVKISGHVLEPGVKLFLEDMRLEDLIFEGGGFENESHLNDTYFDKALLLRIGDDGKTLTNQYFRLDSVLAGKGAATKKIKMGDEVIIYSKQDIYGGIDKKFEIRGHVKRAGDYDIFDGMRLNDVLFMYGGFDDTIHYANTYLRRADLIRIISKDQKQKKFISFNLDSVLSSTSNFNPLINPGDQILIYSESMFYKENFVSIEGFISNPGRYPLKNDMTISDLILESGGINMDGQNFRLELSSIEDNKWDSKKYVKTFVDDFINTNDLFNLYDDKKTILSKKLKPNDHVIIRNSPHNNTQRFVTIIGSVYFPGRYAITNSDEKISDIIKRAGGLNPEAYATSSKFYRQGEQINMSFEKLIKYPRTRANINITDGDSIEIGKKPNLVKVNGAVNNPGSFQFISGQTLKDYIDLAGGYGKDASRFSSFVTYPNGYSEKQSFLKLSPQVLDGSVITVVAKETEESFNFTQYVTNLTTLWADITQAYLMIAIALRN